MVITEKLWSLVEKTATCWNWTGYLNPDGYGRRRIAGRTWLMHRFFYERLVGGIPAELDIDHLCRNRRCVNPAHMEPVTRRENTLRGVGPTAQHARQETCRKGHPFTFFSVKQGRRCHQCWRDASRRYAAKRKKAA